MEPPNPSVERSAFLNSYLGGSKNETPQYMGSRGDTTAKKTNSNSEENGFFSFASKAGSMFGEITANVAAVGEGSFHSKSNTSGVSSSSLHPFSSQSNGTDTTNILPEETQGLGSDFNNLFISWKSESQQEIHGKLLLANKYLATQCESSKAACDELRLKNRKLQEDLNQALVEQKASQKSQQLLAKFDAMQPLKLAKHKLYQEEEEDGVSSNKLGSASLADVFAPTEEDLARKEAAIMEAKRREEERAMLSAARERQYEIDLQSALQAQKTIVHAEAYAEGVAAAEVMLRAEITKVENRAVESEKQVTQMKLELSTEKANHRNELASIKQEQSSSSAATSTNNKNSSNVVDLTTIEKELEEQNLILKQKEEELLLLKKKKSEQVEKMRLEIEQIQNSMKEANIQHVDIKITSDESKGDETAKGRNQDQSQVLTKHYFTDASSILPSLLIDLQPDSPEFEAILYQALQRAAQYKANAENLLAATRSLANCSRTASDAALQVASTLTRMHQSSSFADKGKTFKKKATKKKKTTSSDPAAVNNMDMTSDGEVNDIMVLDADKEQDGEEVNEFNQGMTLLNQIVLSYGEKQQDAAEALELKMVRPLEDFLFTQASLSKQTSELDAMRVSHVKDLEKYLSNKNKSVDRDNFSKRQQQAMESRKKYELMRMDLVSSLRQFQLGENLATARQLVCLSRALLPFDGDEFSLLGHHTSVGTGISNHPDNQSEVSTMVRPQHPVSSTTEASVLANQKKAVHKANTLNTLFDLEKLLDSGDIQSAVYNLDADWDKRTSVFTESIQEMAMLDSLGLDTKKSNEVDRKAIKQASNQVNEVGNSGGGQTAVKRVPGRKRSFAAKNREQAMTQGQLRSVQLGDHGEQSSDFNQGENLHLNGISSLINKSTVVSKADGGGGKLDTSSVQSGYLWEKSEKGKMDRRKDWGRYYYKLHPTKGLIRIRTTPLTLAQAMDITSHNVNGNNTTTFGSIGISSQQEALMLTPDTNRSRAPLYSLLSSPDTQRNARSISPRNFRRASTSSSPRRKRGASVEGSMTANNRQEEGGTAEGNEGGGGGGGGDDEFKHLTGDSSRNRAGKSLERGSPRGSRFGLPTSSLTSSPSKQKQKLTNQFNEDMSSNDLRLSTGMIGGSPRSNPNALMKKSGSFDDLTVDVDIGDREMREKSGSFQEGSTLKSPSSFHLPFGNKAESFLDESVEIVCNEWALCTVRECDKDDDTVLCFQLISPTLQKPITFQADNEQDFSDWTWAMRDQIQGALDDLKNEVSPTTRDRKKPNFFNDDEDFRNLTSHEISQLLSSNPVCADCDQRGPEWVSINLGIMLCITCSGVHRSLGTHVSKVRSLTLDKWSDARLQLMAQVGNVTSNEYMESNISDDQQRPGTDRERQEANDWIKAKYVDYKFLDLKKFISNTNDDEGWKDSETKKYDIGKGLIQSARDGNVPHVLYHLALASALQQYKKGKEQDKITSSTEGVEEKTSMYDMYDIDFVLTSDILSAAYEAASTASASSGSDSGHVSYIAVKEALVLNGYEVK